MLTLIHPTVVSILLKTQGFDVVELDMSIPFSAARARNEGYRHLLERYPALEFIQFVDGDCEVCSGWMASAYTHLIENTELASVCGRRRERFPDKTLYNKLCDIEWNGSVGMVKATGGDFMCRKQALLDVDGFNAQVIAGEEPEMCFRMRQKGWKMERLDCDMTLHDADMTSFYQWWKRFERSGHAYAQGFFMHGNSSEKYYLKDVLRIIVWSLLLPLATIILSVFLSVGALSILLLYPLKIIQMTAIKTKAFGFKVGLAYASSLVLCKFPQMLGVLTFLKKYITRQGFNIIEYKGALKK